MGRLSTIDEAAVFGAVGSQLSTFGALKLADVVAATGVSVGSLYYRYDSREGLLAQAFIDAVKSFQANFLEELHSGGDDAGERGVMATARFCRAHPERARILVCCRKAELINDKTPQRYSEELEGLNRAAYAAIESFANQQGIAVEACMLGMVAYPLAAVRMYLPDREIPEKIDDFLVAAYRSAIEL